MKITPDASVAIMMARGTVRVGSFASSERVDTASNPRNDRHRIAAPAKIGLHPLTVPSPVNGAMRFTLPSSDVATKAITMNTRMNTICTARSTKWARATDTMPTMFRTVTNAIDTRIHTHGGTAGMAALMYI